MYEMMIPLSLYLFPTVHPEASTINKKTKLQALFLISNLNKFSVSCISYCLSLYERQGFITRFF